MLVSRLVALGFVLVTGSLVAIFTVISDPTAGATRLPAELDLKPVEIAAEPFDALAPLYLKAGDENLETHLLKHLLKHQSPKTHQRLTMP